MCLAINEQTAFFWEFFLVLSMIFLNVILVILCFGNVFDSKINNYFTKILVNENFSPSNNPKSDNFRLGITKSAINDRLIKGEANVQPNCLANW